MVRRSTRKSTTAKRKQVLGSKSTRKSTTKRSTTRTATKKRTPARTTKRTSKTTKTSRVKKISKPRT